MLTELINKFRDANGRSDFVIAVMCDIRGFSSFSKIHEAPDIAMFSKRFFVKLLEDYFVDADFAKATGDGMLLIYRYSEKNLHEVAETVLTTCMDVVRDFPELMHNDSMINYPVPDKVGFGIVRGTAFCLYSDREAVDYSGQTLNLAARLTEFARPSGIVIDGTFMMSVIPEQLHEDYYTETVFVRGISEDRPREVFCSNEVVIPAGAKIPEKNAVLRSVDHNVTVALVKKMPETVTVKLPEEPLSTVPCKSKVQWTYSTANWIHRRAPSYTQWRYLADTAIEHTADGYFTHLQTDEILKIINEEKLGAKSELLIRVQYAPALPRQPLAAAPNEKIEWVSNGL
jgi:hypothetical protein